MTAENDVEIRGQTVEEAIEAGLSQLGLDRSDVIIDVIDEGSKGILGIGVREAVVRLVPMGGGAKPAPSTSTPPPGTAVSSQPTLKPSKTDDKERTRQPASIPSLEEVAEERDVALEIVETILQQMQIEATVAVDLSEPDDLTGRQINEFRITGNDLGVLIGPRGETLNSLQFITRLMVGHRLQRRADFIIDIEGYRERRRLALARLGERMANKVMKQGRPITLEPMPAQDRRIIHMTLRNSEEVYTQSTGEGNRRRVRILPK